MARLACTSRGLLSTPDSIATPSWVKTRGSFRRPPRPVFDVAICSIKRRLSSDLPLHFVPGLISHFAISKMTGTKRGGKAYEEDSRRLDKYIQMVILPETPFGLVVVFFRSSPQAGSPIQEEYERAVRQPQERRKIEQVLSGMERFGLRTPGLRVEKVKGAGAALFELKITAGGAEHRFLAGYNGVRTPEGKPYLVLVGYLKKKEWKLSRSAIEAAVARLARME